MDKKVVKKWHYPGIAAKRDMAIAVKMLEIEVLHLSDQLELRVISGVLTKAEVLNQIKSKEGLYKAWINRQRLITNELIRKNIAAPANIYGKEHPKQKFKWVLNSKEPCSDCVMLANQSPRTIAEWRKFGLGLPGDNLRKCNYGCRCNLRKVN